MRKSVFIVLFLLLHTSIIGSLFAQESAQSATSYRLTITPAQVRECPQRSCAVISNYPIGTIVIVSGIEQGDENLGSTDWLHITDALTGAPGYMHSTLTEDYEPEPWQIAPVTPEVTETAREIFQRGLELGNDPAAFSKVGDCQNVSSFFLAGFDTPEEFNLGPFAPLQSTVDHFNQSWARESVSVDNGFNVASVLSPLWSDAELCNTTESPIACEYRLHTPSIVIISMETWWSGRPASEYEEYLSQIVEYWIEQGVVPILGSKADNWEGDHSINRAIYNTALKYDVPYWNFWLAVQALPNHGLTEDDFHLTYARDFYDDRQRLRNGWPVRNLTALQAIDAVFRGVSEVGG